MEFASVQVQYWRELAALGKLLGNAGEIGQKVSFYFSLNLLLGLAMAVRRDLCVCGFEDAKHVDC